MDEFEAGRGANWRDSLDERGRPTHGPALAPHPGCQYCFGPLDAKKGSGDYECPWCIARFPNTTEAVCIGECSGHFDTNEKCEPTDPWWYVWLPRAVYSVIVFSWISLVLWALAPLIGWWLR